MKGGHLVFREWLCDCSIVSQHHLLPGVSGGGRRSTLQPLCTVSSGATTPTGAMLTSATSSGVAEYVIFHPQFSAIKIMIISVVYMLVSLRLHVHISEITNLLLLFFWIKLLLKLPNYLTGSQLYYDIWGSWRSQSAKVITNSGRGLIRVPPQTITS